MIEYLVQYTYNPKVALIEQIKTVRKKEQCTLKEAYSIVHEMKRRCDNGL